MSALLSTVSLLLCLQGVPALDLFRVTRTPADAPIIPRVHCWCNSYPDTTLCSWPETSHEPHTHYITTYRERHGHPMTNNCLVIPPTPRSPSSGSSSSSDQEWLCQLSDLKLFTDYIINVTAVSPAGSSSFLSGLMMEDIVKPDPPVDVRVSLQNKRHLLVEWSPPSSWRDLEIFPLKYHIRYQWENRGSPKSVNLGPFESTSVELKGLSPGRQYQLQVCSRELMGLGSCSDWSSPVYITVPRTNL
uniref:Epstein-Barr virus induced 3 n=1 Tax=Cynoglossus semilaevis TaxID=244447 RepID=A0A3P8V562_CYNSE